MYLLPNVVVPVLSGVVTTLAGPGSYAYTDGIGISASFFRPSGIAVTSAGIIYITDMYNNRVRMITGESPKFCITLSYIVYSNINMYVIRSILSLSVLVNASFYINTVYTSNYLNVLLYK